MYNSKFGSYFKELRLSQKLTRKELSELTGFSISKITDIERARLKPNTETVSAMSKTNLFSKEELTELEKYVPKTKNKSNNTDPEIKPVCSENTECSEINSEDKSAESEKDSIDTTTDTFTIDETIKLALETHPYLNDLIMVAYAYGITKKQCKKIKKKIIKKYEKNMGI